MDRQNRVSRGIPEGGRYATSPRGESTTTLTPTLADAEGFPARACNACAGRGMIQSGRCFGCAGKGLTPADQRTKKAIAAYERARRLASRPQAGDVEVGQIVAPVSKTPGRAEWGRVAKKGISTKPSAHVIKDGEKVPSAWWTKIVLEDGREMVVSSDVIVQRRSDGVVDPAPFIAQAMGETDGE